MLLRLLTVARRAATPVAAAATVAAASYATVVTTAPSFSEPSSTSTHSVAAAAHGSTLNNLLSRVVALERRLIREERSPKYVVVSPTFYPNLDDVRLQLGLEACRKAKALGVPLLLVDASPPEVRAALEEAGAVVHVQTAKGRKGAALRECIQLAHSVLPPDGVVCFQELEKVEMVGLQHKVAAHIARTGCDVCVPKRADGAFKATYPIEQYHQENFANLYLNTLGVQAGLPDGIDWTFGPTGFRASAARHWLQCEGELWDAQIVPFVHAARWHAAHVTVLELDYMHPPAMKVEEEGVAKWGEKRLDQLNFLFKHVGGALKQSTPPE